MCASTATRADASRPIDVARPCYPIEKPGTDAIKLLVGGFGWIASVSSRGVKKASSVALNTAHIDWRSSVDHVEFLAKMKRILRPNTYIEIGIASGTTLFSDPIPNFVIGIDPNPAFESKVGSRLNAVHNSMIMRSTSDNAFAQLSSQRLLGDRKCDMAFVDGLHHCEVVLRDIANCARLSREHALIFVHDIFPGNEIEASRQPPNQPGSWMGDVYKVVPAIWQFLDWIPTVLVVDVPPSGMFILRTGGDIYNGIMKQIQNLEAAMASYDFASVMQEMRAKAISHSSRPLAAFIEESIGELPEGETAAQFLICSMMS